MTRKFISQSSSRMLSLTFVVKLKVSKLIIEMSTVGYKAVNGDTLKCRFVAFHIK